MFGTKKSRTHNILTRSATRRRANPVLEALDARLLLSADYFGTAGVPSTLTAGASFTITVTEYATATNKVVTNDNGLVVTVSDISNGLSASLGNVAMEGGVGKETVTLTRDGTYAISAASDAMGNFIGSKNSESVQVTPGAATQLFVSVPLSETPTAGENFNLEIQAQDKFDNTFNYSGNVTFKASDGQAVTGNGVVTNGVTTVELNIPDTVALTATTRVGSISGTSNVITENAISQTNSIWSGYAAGTGPGVTAAGGTWVQPSGSGTNGSADSVWVGIDGFGGSTVEQCGTATTIVNGVPQIVAWYEIYGDQSGSKLGPDYYQQNIAGFTVKPGDTISAEVSLVPGTTNSFLFQMTDKPKAGGPTETFLALQTPKYVTAQRSTAEWIVENPNNDAQPLANFGQVNFSGAYATVNSTTTPINKLANLRALNMESGNSLLDVTTNPPGIANTLGYNEPASGLQSSSFAITYIGNNPGSFASPSAEPLPTTLLSFNDASSNQATGAMASLAPADHLKILDAAFEGWHREIGQGTGLGSHDHIDDLFA